MGKEITKLWSRLGFTKGGPDEPGDVGLGGHKTQKTIAMQLG